MYRAILLNTPAKETHVARAKVDFCSLKTAWNYRFVFRMGYLSTADASPPEICDMGCLKTSLLPGVHQTPGQV